MFETLQPNGYISGISKTERKSGKVILSSDILRKSLEKQYHPLSIEKGRAAHTYMEMKIFEYTFPSYEDLQILGMLFTCNITLHATLGIEHREIITVRGQSYVSRLPKYCPLTVIISLRY